MKRLPVLDPCHEDWSAMVGRDAERFCESCRTRVFDLSSMSERAARNLLADNPGKTLCVRFRADAAGNVVHAPRSAPPVAAGALLSVTLAGGCAGHGAEDLFEMPSEDVCTDIDGSMMECERDDDFEPPFLEEVPVVRSEPPPVENDADEMFREDDDGYWFDEEPIVAEQVSETAPDEGCQYIESGITMGVMVVVADVDYREERTQAYLREHTDRVRAWLAERREGRRARRAERRAARSKLSSR